MSFLAKIVLVVFMLVCCLQFVFMARLRREDTSADKAKSVDSIDINALGNMILDKLKDSLKNGDETLKNILDVATNSFQQYANNAAAAAA